jgi:hypothetical protein
MKFDFNRTPDRFKVKPRKLYISRRYDVETKQSYECHPFGTEKRAQAGGWRYITALVITERVGPFHDHWCGVWCNGSLRMMISSIYERGEPLCTKDS